MIERLCILEAKAVSLEVNGAPNYNVEQEIGTRDRDGNDTYAEVVKNKNLLVVRSTDENRSVSDRKDEHADALSDILVMYTKFTERKCCDEF